jgi:hypothetical protein
MFYVNMRDKFMSGWGCAPGNSYKVVACDTLEQAEAIEQAARQRPEMRAVSIADKPRRARSSRDHVSLSHFSDMGGPWLRFWRGPHPKAATREG